MAKTFGIAEKGFMLVMGVIMIVLMYRIFMTVTQSSCFPSEAYMKDPVFGFSSGIFENVNDNICNMMLTMNSGIWQIYRSYIGRNFASGFLLSISETFLNAAKPFCKTRSNLDFSRTDSDDAITDPEVMLELFLFDMERCWNIFEGRNLNGEYLTDRDPLPSEAFFKCSEIIYFFNEGQNLSFDRIYQRLEGSNTCGEKINIPNDFFWCAPKELMSDLWHNKNTDFKYYEKTESGYGIFDAPDNGNQNDINWKPIDSTFCLKNNIATASFGEIYGYNYNNEGISVIDGAGKISIYYFDAFEWKGAVLKDTAKMSMHDYLPGCGGINVFNGLIEGTDINLKNAYRASSNTLDDHINWQHHYLEINQNTLVICYEKYDMPSYECVGNLDCSKINWFSLGLHNSDCDYAAGCYVGDSNQAYALGTACKNQFNCSSFTTPAKCESNNEGGCSWQLSGSCKLNAEETFNCNNCAADFIGTKSQCDKSSLCKEALGGLGECYQLDSQKSCDSIDSQYLCELSSCAGCYWEEN